MGDITLNQLRDFMLWAIAFGTATATIINAVKKAIEKGFKPINEKIDKVDKNATMNYLVARIEEIDGGKKLEGVNRQRFFEEYEHYTKDLQGNSYIKEEVERLKKESKL